MNTMSLRLVKHFIVTHSLTDSPIHTLTHSHTHSMHVLFAQVEALSANEVVKIPIAVLKVGESRVVQPELEFPYGPVTFTLIEGNGPIYIHGQQVPNGYEDQVVDGGEEYDSDEELVRLTHGFNAICTDQEIETIFCVF